MTTKTHTPPKAPTQATLKALEKRLTELRERERSLDEKCRMASIAVQAAGFGLAIPHSISDPTEAYRWFAAASARVGRHQSTTHQMDAASQIRAEFLTPAEVERKACQDEIKEVDQQRRQVKDALEAAEAPQMIDQHEGQIKLLEKSRKMHQANVDRLTKDAATLRTELTDLVAAEQAFDDQLAQDVAAGKPVDDDALVSMQATRLAREKRLKVTMAAHQKATQATQADRDAIDKLMAEVRRLRAVIDGNKVKAALAETFDRLTEEGIPVWTVEEMMHAFKYR